MNSEVTVNTLLVTLSGVAMLGVMIQWFRSDEASVAVGGLQRSAAESVFGSLPSLTATATAETSVDAQPLLIGDDETALSRLCFGGGLGGTIVGLAAGAVISGFVGALVGSVAASTLAIAAVVLYVVARDRATMATWRTARAAR
ncbi:MAG: hypothetical protein WCJ30_01770 [Deltaproteobacteria bacterium]